MDVTIQVLKLFLLLIVLSSQDICAHIIPTNVVEVGKILKITPDKKAKYQFPFFLYLPQKFDRVMVMPNNSSFRSNSLEETEAAAQRELLKWTDLAENTHSALLVPVFIRPDVEPSIYTHSLSRAALEVREGNLKRIDLQLVEMISDSLNFITIKLKKKVNPKVSMFGFSASAMFVNRFSFLHPEIISSIAFGAPGGWPLAPLQTYQGKELTYPIGISDLEKISGKKIEIEKIKTIPMFIFIGGKDENDSVVFRDSYSEEQQKIVFDLFGDKPVKRWKIAETLYSQLGFTSTFKIYDDVGHGTNKTIHQDIFNFFNLH